MNSASGIGTTPSNDDDATNDTAGLDAVPNGQGADGVEGDAENPPLPDWGPTDGEHGVDDDEPAVQ
ncbi:hypothetical protein [Marisediminicola sp. LYQ85]|uniref:hypothetical protein n=1 Tax=Marisediminicola sp. LYQ85 TaxID=3391062 RepID=UPI00398327CA